MAIQANELRIGNLFLEGEIDAICNSEQMRKCEVVNIKTKSRSFEYIELLTPIPLTEEWLLKFGAEVYEFDSGRPNQYRIKNRLFVIRNGEIVDYGCSVAIQYVHQLQNLYLALAGEELTMKT